MNEQIPPAQNAIAGPDDTGKTCPYCRFPVKEQSSITVCGACSSVHHDDCWADNGGCSVVGCIAGPSSDATTHVAPPIPAVGPAPTIIQDPIPPGVPPAAPPAPMYPGPPDDGKSAPPPTGPIAWQPASQPPKRSPWLAISVLVLALAVAGAGAAVAISNSNDAATVDTADPASSEGTSSSEGLDGNSAAEPDTSEAATDDESSMDATDGMDGALPAISKRTMNGEIRDMLLTWHQNVLSGDYRSAWLSISSRKRKQTLRKDGYAAWKSYQASLSPYLDPSGIRVKILDTDSQDGVVTVDVKGMTWSEPGAGCSTWSGITWVKYERGEWKYEPGYSTTKAREAAWKDRFSELLGGQCS